MPRYAKGSLERTLYRGFKQAARGLEPKKERKNSALSRAHRHEQFTTPDTVTCAERLRAIQGVLNLWDNKFCTPENAIKIIHDITKGE